MLQYNAYWPLPKQKGRPKGRPGRSKTQKSVAVHEKSQDVPEHHRYRGKQLHRGGNVLFFVVVVHDVRGVIKNGGAGEADHSDREPGSELHAKYQAGDD